MNILTINNFNNINFLLCCAFFISLTLHFVLITAYEIQKIYFDANKYTKSEIFCYNYYETNNNKNIFSTHVNIKYVLIVFGLMSIKQHILILGLSSILFLSAYLKYMTIIVEIIHKYNECTHTYSLNIFNKNIALTLFLCMWLSIYFYIIGVNGCISYILLTFSLCLTDSQ